MAKKIIQDIYVVKKSIRDIKRSDVRDGFYTKKEPVEQKPLATKKSFLESMPEKQSIDNSHLERKNWLGRDSLIFVWIICIASVATLLFLLSSTFATATLTITPKNQTINLNDIYNATLDKNTNGLHYEIMTLKKESSKNLATDGEEYIERKATGKAVLYNNFSTSNQRLIINTRLETKDGFIYKTRNSVNIPGMKVVNGVKTPGSIEVEIIADVPGDEYNMALTDFKGDFTVPGFKGSPKYAFIYGRLSTDMSGGHIGKIQKISEEKLKAGREEVKNALKTDLIKEMYAKKPDQYTLFNNNYYTECTDKKDDQSGSDYKISEECSIHAVMFNTDLLSAFIAQNKIKGFDNVKVDVLWNDNMMVTLTGATEKLWNEPSLKVKLSGSAIVAWSFDGKEIAEAIAGQNRDIINYVIESNKNSIQEIESTVRPMWKKTFPENEKKIKIIDTIRDGIR